MPTTSGSDRADTCAYRALVVEDDASIRNLLRDFLAVAGITADLVPCGRDAIETFSAGAYDLVLTDYTMPGMTGLELAHALRRLDPAVPIAIVTGSIMADVIGAIRAARFEILAKPFGLAVFKRTVHGMLRRPPRLPTTGSPSTSTNTRG